MKFRCEDFDGCIDKILDNSASEDVRSAFFLHLSECENCCREYENAKFIKETLRDRSPKLDEDFTSSVMARISKRRKPLSRSTALCVSRRPLPPVCL